MDAIIEEFANLLPFDAPEDCGDKELFYALKAYRLCREGAWEGTRLGDIGLHVRSWLDQPSSIERMNRAIQESCVPMRHESLGIYIVKQLPDYRNIASDALSDDDDNIRCLGCEALHDLAANGNQVAELEEKLIGLARSDPNYFVRSRAASALGFYSSDAVIRVLKDVMESDHEFDEQFVVESPSTAAEYALKRIETRRRNSR